MRSSPSVSIDREGLHGLCSLMHSYLQVEGSVKILHTLSTSSRLFHWNHWWKRRYCPFNTLNKLFCGDVFTRASWGRIVGPSQDDEGETMKW